MNQFAYIRREVFNLTQIEFAELVGTDQGTVSFWENGRRFPQFEHMQTMRSAAKKRRLAWDDRWFFEAPKVAA